MHRNERGGERERILTVLEGIMDEICREGKRTKISRRREEDDSG